MADPKEKAEEEDKVAAAYENISKKLESIRNGKTPEEDTEEDSEESKVSEGSNDEDDLEEWKGPRLMKNEEGIMNKEEDEEVELRKVKLRNLEEDDMEESDESKVSKEKDELEEDEESDAKVSSDKEELEGLPGTDEEKRQGSKIFKASDIAGKKRDWEPKENDPLDKEDLEEGSKVSKESEGEDEVEDQEDSEGQSVKVSEDEAEESEKPRYQNVRPTNFNEVESEADFPKKEPQPDTLDDLTSESSFSKASDVAEAMSDKSADEDDGYFIPKLKGSRQEGSNMGYNTPSEMESFGREYQEKSSMENNDPNNFFSQHNQPHPPKRANKFHLLILVAIGIAVIGFTVYILKGGFGQISLTSQASPSPSPVEESPSVTPTPTPEPTIERGEFTVRVLNGTSTTGLAKTVNDKLKELGYKTGSPGNATEKDVEQTEIRVKEGTQSAVLFERLKLDLAPDYDAKAGERLDEKSANDAEVILGSK